MPGQTSKFALAPPAVVENFRPSRLLHHSPAPLRRFFDNSSTKISSTKSELPVEGADLKRYKKYNYSIRPGNETMRIGDDLVGLKASVTEGDVFGKWRSWLDGGVRVRVWVGAKAVSY